MKSEHHDLGINQIYVKCACLDSDVIHVFATSPKFCKQLSVDALA